MIDNILSMYRSSSEFDKAAGKFWYPAARVQCEGLASEFCVDLERVVYATAALSPMLKWETNIAATRAVLQDRRPLAVFSSNVEKAAHILWDSEDWQRHLSGNKVTSFARNILGDVNTVTVDTWAWRIAEGVLAGSPPNLDKSGLYWLIAEEYRAAAAHVGLLPSELQAITWVTIRRLVTNRTGWGQLSLPM